ncbi:hypothetical protein DL93DRAFT_2084517 [Clavulina sp. PMI_390]|nr:hypothetical protein DL93DRAFT_2084517 [Clavulina sp. PMI_390]
MILDDAKAARKAREQQEQDENDSANGNYPDEQASVLPAPPAYEPRSAPMSPSSPPMSPQSEWSSSQAGPSNLSGFAAGYAIPSSASSSSSTPLASPTSPTQRTPLLRSPLSPPISPSALWHQAVTLGSGPGGLDPGSPSSDQKKDSTNVRFLKALAVAYVFLLIYCLIGLSSIAFADTVKHSGPKKGPYSWGKPALPLKADGTLFPWTGCDVGSFEQPVGDPSELAEDVRVALLAPHPPHEDGIEVILHPETSYPSSSGSRGGRKDRGENNDGDKRNDERRDHDRGNDKPYGAPFESEAFFTMPSDKVKHFYLLARGSHAQGRVKYVEGVKADTPVVSVQMFYWHPEMRNSINICMLTHNGTSQGVGIFTPEKRWDWMPAGQRHVSFDIVVVLPKSDYSTKVTQLESDVPRFNQLFNHVDSELDLVRTRSRDGDFTVEGELHAKVIDVVTTNAEIYGQFWTDDSIHLETTNAGISTNIRLINERSRPTSAVLKSSSGSIVTQWRLSSIANRASPSYPGYDGHFAIDATTSNALVYHTFEYAPINPNVLFDTRSSGSSISVALWRTMEGPFELHGQIGVPLIETHLKPGDDPMQLGRDPILKILAFSRDTLEGFFHWRQPLTISGDGADAAVAPPSVGITKTNTRIRIFAENGKPIITYV